MKTKFIMIGTLICFVLSGSGMVLSQEFEASPEESGPRKLRKMDVDGDGKISLEEFLARSERRFEKMDADGDDYLTADEFKIGRKAKREKRRARRE